MSIVPIRRLAAGTTVALTLALVAGCGNITTPASSSASSASSASNASVPTAPASSSSAATPTASGTTGSAAVNTGSQYAQYYKVTGTPVTVAAGKTVKMTLTDFSFDPNTLTVAKGTKVTIAVSNPTPLQHTFTLDAFGVDQSISPNGGTATVSFTPTTAGTYYWYCKVPGHAQLGMVGKLTVK